MFGQTISTLPQDAQALGGLSSQSICKREWSVIFILTIAALILRLAAFFLFQEMPGDGPSHAMLAYMWSKSPVFMPHSVWLPGYIYLTGIFNMVVNDPLVSTRIFNLLFGTLTVPVFYLLIRRIFDHISALLCATLLVVFPFHISLSVTSLSEVSFLVEIIVGTLLVLQASVTTNWRRYVYLILSIFVLGISSLTRYEVWILLPLFPMYYFLKTGRFHQSLFLAIGLAMPPIVWMAASFFGTGYFLPGYEAALFEVKAGGGVTLHGALRIIAHNSINYLGWIIPLLAAGGFLLLFVDAAKKQLSKERLLYLAIVAITGFFIVKFAMDRGLSFIPRYLIFIFIMSFPLCTFVISRYLNFRIKSYFIILAVLLVAAPPFISQVVNKRALYVTQKTTHGIEVLGRWLADSPFRDSPLLLTKMGWNSTYLPLYRPEIAFRYIIVSEWIGDSRIRDFISIFQPQLLITRDGEHEFISRIEKLIGAQIREDRLVYDKDTFKAYDLKGLNHAVKYSTAPNNCCVLVGPGFLIRDAKPVRVSETIANHNFDKEARSGDKLDVFTMYEIKGLSVRKGF